MLFVRWHYATEALFVVASPPPRLHRLAAFSFSFVLMLIAGEKLTIICLKKLLVTSTERDTTTRKSFYHHILSPGEKSPLDTNMAYGRSLLKYNTTTPDHIAVRTDSLIRGNAGKATLQN